MRRRNRPGCLLDDYFSWCHQSAPTITASNDDPFAVQCYLQHLVRRHPHRVRSLVQMPPATLFSSNGSEDIDESAKLLWQYEHLRLLCAELGYAWVVLLTSECTAETCKEMKAEEWLFLCAAHASPQSCCAMDYMMHTLDGATSLLNSNKHFPSRLAIPASANAHFQNMARRLYRIFAHTWFAHRDLFVQCEAETHLYERFVTLCRTYEWVNDKVIIIPESYLQLVQSSDDPQSDEEVEDIAPMIQDQTF